MGHAGSRISKGFTAIAFSILVLWLRRESSRHRRKRLHAAAAGQQSVQRSVQPVPEPLPALCVDAAPKASASVGFCGNWKNNRGTRANISGATGTFPEVDDHPFDFVDLGNGRCELKLNGVTCSGKLDADSGELTWCDGDVWHREEASSSRAASASNVSLKFCGIRWTDAGQPLPDTRPFSFEPFEAPDSFEGALEYADGERERLQELREAVADVHAPGHKDCLWLLRYLRAKQGNVQKAAAQFRSSVQWRKDNPFYKGFSEGTLDDELHRRVDEYWKPCGLVGWSKDGLPVVWSRAGRVNNATFVQLPDEFLEAHEIYTQVRVQQAFEEHMRATGKPLMYLLCIEDVFGLGWEHCGMTGLLKFKKLVRINEDYFPDLLGKAFVIRGPWIFATIWAIVSKFFDDAVREKIHITHADDTHRLLREHVDTAWIPEELGGKLRIGDDPKCGSMITVPRPIPQELIDEIVRKFPPHAT